MRLRAQGSTEYLVLLAAALLIALAVVGILAYYPGTSEDAKKTQSDLYWRKAYPIAVLETTGHGDTHLLRLKNIGNERVIIRGINVSGSTSIGLGYSNALYAYRGQSGELKSTVPDCASPQGQLQCDAATHSILNCSVALPPGREIWVQYFIRDSVSGDWTGEPTDACGMHESGGDRVVLLNSLRRHAEVKNIKIYYSTSQSSPITQVESGTEDLYVTCGDYGPRNTEGTACKVEYGCGLGGVGIPGYCADYVY